jgi:hypothetical protein
MPQNSLRWIAHYKLLGLFLTTAIILAGAAFLRLSSLSLTKLAVALLSGLIFLEGVVNTTYPRQRRWDVFAHPPSYVRTLQNMRPNSRVFVFAALNANLGSAFCISEFDSLYAFVSTRMYELYMRYTNAPKWIFLREAKELPPNSVLDSAGINQLLIRTEFEQLRRAARDRGFFSIYVDDFVEIFLRPSTRRAFFTSDYEVANRVAALELIGSLRPRHVVLEEGSSLLPVANRQDDPDIDIVSSRLNSLSMRVRAPRPGLVYLADAYDDGWSATVNGRPVKIAVANYAFRSVVVPEGEVKVQFSYIPPGFNLGIIISVAGLCVAMALALSNPGEETCAPSHDVIA